MADTYYYRQCEYCGTWFWHTNPNARFDSDKCRQAAYRARHNTPTLYKLTCAWCGCEFLAARPTAKYHSKACRMKAYRARKKEEES